MENTTVLEDIKTINSKFKSGIYFYEYLSLKKLTKSKLEYKAEEKLHQAMCLLVRGKITRDEYNNLKNKVDKTKKYYYKLLTEV